MRGEKCISTDVKQCTWNDIYLLHILNYKYTEASEILGDFAVTTASALKAQNS